MQHQEQDQGGGWVQQVASPAAGGAAAAGAAGSAEILRAQLDAHCLPMLALRAMAACSPQLQAEALRVLRVAPCLGLEPVLCAARLLVGGCWVPVLAALLAALLAPVLAVLLLALVLALALVLLLDVQLPGQQAH